MVKALKSYQNRPGYDCEDLHNEDEPCWGPVFGSSRGIECEGHRGGTYKTPEQVQAELEEGRRRWQEEVAAQKRQKAQEEDEREANRWFRPYVERARTVQPGALEKLSDPMLKMVFSMVGAGHDVECRTEEVKAALIEMIGLPAIAEVATRGLPWPEYPYQLKLLLRQDELKLDTGSMSDVELKLWFGCAAFVMDFSCLDTGVRLAISFIYDAVGKECKRRTSGYLPFLFDLTKDDLKEGWDDGSNGSPRPSEEPG